MRRNIRRNIVVAVAVLVALPSVFMTGCGNKEIGGGEMTFSETLTAKDTVIWYDVDSTDGDMDTFDKDSAVGGAMVFTGDTMDYYGWSSDYVETMPTIGQFAKMSDEEVLKELERLQLESISNGKKALEKQLDDAITNAENSAAREDYEKMKKDLSGVNPEDLLHTPSDYILTIYTDGSGNNTQNERLSWVGAYTPYLINAEGAYTNRTDKAVGVMTQDKPCLFYAFSDHQTAGDIYDSYYAGFFMENDKAAHNLLVRCKEGTVITTDAPDSKAVDFLDPQEDYWKDWAKERGAVLIEEREAKAQEMYDALQYKGWK